MRENQFVVFRLNEGEYGIEIMSVKEIIRYKETVKIPNVPGFIKGIINYRSSTVPIIDLNKKFNIKDKGISDTTRIVIVNTDRRHVGFMVDEVEEVLKISEDNIDSVPEIIESIDRQYIMGIGKLGDRLIILLNLTKVLSEFEKEKLEAMVPEGE